MADRQVLIFSRATYVGASGATAAATYAFYTSDYQPPSQDRYIDQDVVKNQNGKFKYLYDNGPGWRKWAPFEIVCENTFTQFLGVTALAQYQQLVSLWEHPGVLGMQAPEGTYTVHWSSEIERSFRVFPTTVNDVQEFRVVVQFEEAQ